MMNIKHLWRKNTFKAVSRLIYRQGEGEPVSEKPHGKGVLEHLRKAVEVTERKIDEALLIDRDILDQIQKKKNNEVSELKIKMFLLREALLKRAAYTLRESSDSIQRAFPRVKFERGNDEEIDYQWLDAQGKPARNIPRQHLPFPSFPSYDRLPISKGKTTKDMLLMKFKEVPLLCSDDIFYFEEGRALNDLEKSFWENPDKAWEEFGEMLENGFESIFEVEANNEAFDYFSIFFNRMIRLYLISKQTNASPKVIENFEKLLADNVSAINRFKFRNGFLPSFSEDEKQVIEHVSKLNPGPK